MLTFSTTQTPPPTDWQRFEHLCWVLWREIWGDQRTKKNGRKGQSQCGVDVYGQSTKGQWSGVQCKGKDNFTAQRVTQTELRSEVEKAKRFRPRLSHFILATTAPSDAKIQELARTLTVLHQRTNLFSVDVCSWDDIRDLLDQHKWIVSELYEGAAFAKESGAYADSLKGLERKIGNRLDAQTRTLLTATQICTSYIRGDDLSTQRPDGVTNEQLLEIVSILQNRRRNIYRSKNSVHAIVLPHERTHILGILTTAPIPLPIAMFKGAFSDVDWNNHLAYFKRRNLVEEVRGFYRVPAKVARTFIRSDADRLPYVEKWIDKLSPLSSHPDMALLLGMQQLTAGRHVDALRTLVESAEHLLPGVWNDLHLKLLQQLRTPALLRQLTNEQRARYFLSVALCLFRTKQYAASVSAFVELRRFCKRVHINWGIGRSYHDCGIVFLESGNRAKAEQCFRESIQLSRKTRNRFLLGRSLYELGLTLSQSRPDEAARAFAESEAVKKKVRDSEGFVGIYHGRAVIAIQKREFKEALRWFTKAEKAAERSGQYHAQALERYNIGKCNLDINQYKEALPHLLQAATMAEADALKDVLVLAVGAEAMALVKLEKFGPAERAFRRLYELQSELGNDAEMVVALHDVGACLMGRHKYREARRILSQAAKLGRHKKIFDWAYQSQIDISNCYMCEGSKAKAISELKRAATEDERNRLFELASRLWAAGVTQLIERGSRPKDVFDVVDRCFRAAKRASDSATIKMQVYLSLHSWHWNKQQYEPAIKALEDLLACAIESGDADMACQAHNQIGVCLQELNMYAEAVSRLRAALRLARKLNDPDLLDTCLNNLGEALRHLGKYEEAISLLEEAERNSLDRNDYESALSIAHNKALAIQDQGDFEIAESIFRKCRDESRKRGYQYEYVRSLHALANLSWHRGRPRTAERRYVKALEAAEKYKAKNRHQICINYANALRFRGDAKKAATILASAESEFAANPDAHLYYSQFALHYEDSGRKRLAAKYWKAAQTRAQQTGSKEALAFSSGSLGELYDDAGRFDEADTHYQRALENESEPDSRA